MFLETSGSCNDFAGYAGGNKSNPTYYEVCSGLTGHSEVVSHSDKSEIDISDLLKMFWECHDPTQKINRVMILELNIDQQYILKMNKTKISFSTVKNNIKKN